MHNGLVTVFGGSGFLGKHVVRALARDGWRVRVPMRRPHLGHELRVMGTVGQVQLMQANLRFPASVDAALDGADAAVNLVALLFERGKQTFDAVHVDGAQSFAQSCRAHGIDNVAHVSAIGANTQSKSNYSRTKGEAEDIIKEMLPQADIIRPSIIFGEGDGFFTRFAQMASMAPALPLLGRGQTRFQPVHVVDVAEAIATVIRQGTSGQTYELGGPRAYTFKELMQFILQTIDKRRVLAPIPWALAGPLGYVGELGGMLPIMDPMITRDQVEDLKTDNVVADDALGFKALGLTPTTIEAVVPEYLARFRKHGQFHDSRSPEAYR